MLSDMAQNLIDYYKELLMNYDLMLGSSILGPMRYNLWRIMILYVIAASTQLDDYLVKKKNFCLTFSLVLGVTSQLSHVRNT